MTKAKKAVQLQSLDNRRRSKMKDAESPADGRTKRIDRILAEANIDERSREVFADAAVRYAPLMKRLADK